MSSYANSFGRNYERPDERGSVKIKSIMRNICLVAFGVNIVLMGFAMMVPSLHLFILAACSSILVLYGFLFGYSEDNDEQ